jgi:hypothetical protein
VSENDQLREIIQKIVSQDNKIIFDTDTIEPLEVDDSNNRVIFISQLEHLIDLPKQIRTNLYNGQIRKVTQSSDVDSCIHKVLSVSRDLLTKEIGKDAASKWREIFYSRIRQIIAAEGIYGVLNGNAAIIKIKQTDRKKEFEINETLIFSFPGNEKAIATRKMAYGSSAELFEHWDVVAGYDELFSSLESLHDKSSGVKQLERKLHLFVWSDSPLNTFQESFLFNVFSNHINVNLNNYKFEAGVILLSSTTSRSGSLTKYGFSNKEFLSLQRVNSGGTLYLAPGAMEDIFTNEAMRLNRPHSVFESKFHQDVEQKMIELELIELRMMKEYSISVHEPIHDLVGISAFAISSGCWTGTWAESLEIDGEQVM